MGEINEEALFPLQQEKFFLAKANVPHEEGINSIN